MKKIFTLFAAALFAGSMMAGNLIKFDDIYPVGSLDGVTFGEDFTLTITDNNPNTSRRKVYIDQSDATFGFSETNTITFTYRLKTGAKSSDANKMTLVVPEEGPLVIYARTVAESATDRYFVIANGSDTIVKHICLETDTVEDASSKIFLPVLVENVPAGIYEITYNNAINFYGFQLGYDEPAGPDEYASLSDLINNAGAPAGQEVVVTLTNETIDSLYVSRAGKTNGIYLTAAGHVVEIYCYGVPSQWVAGGTVSGVVTGDWVDSWGTWQLCPTSWNGISYTAPAPTAINAVATERKAQKVIENGQMVIIRDGKKFNAVGAQL